MKTDIIQDFLTFIQNQKDPEYTIRPVHDEDGDHIGFVTEYAEATVTVYELKELNVAELKIVNLKNGKVTFYLHFELKDLDHAEELFREMIASLKSLKKEQRISVLLCCTSGITTSYFTSKLTEASELLGLNYSFQAVSYSRLYTRAFDSDVILLAPQISYLYDRISEILSDKTVIRIPAGIFGAYDVPKLLTLVASQLRSREREMENRKVPAERTAFLYLHRTLAVAVLIENQSVRILYRIYDRGQVRDYGSVIKESYRLSDLEDLMDVALAKDPAVETVIVVTPGVYCDGCLTFRQPGIYNVDIRKMFTERYGRRFIFLNDANAMALGYYGLQKETENLSFYFHPMAARTSGVGNIVSGRLMKGRNNLCGEMQYVARTISYSDDPNRLAMTPEGTLEIVTKFLVSIIANVDPEVIAVYCDMVPDMKELHDALSEYIQPEFVPKLVKVTDCVEYMFAGGMMEAAGQEHEQQK